VEDILAIVFLFGGGTLGLLAYSPVGRAWADRIRGRTAPGARDPQEQAEREELREAVAGLRREVAELAERVDFTERLLARAREGTRLGPGDVAR
jgi:hypothetical protein